ncbi:hypothetical protein [Curtobacterium sp. MCBD17_040]|uniref:hypothetical protein n=1 Tax=Curtobacterium sp. MCBD17_040 TaxID=2175674 RepID=UPI000DA83B2A|nr:hypothetical protein [Curtobacterium sp. MCBD17_040]WIB65738.1 hypothetical protein DEI94_16600 [Curtobacterium sp. MCBD17_040]
MRQRPRPRTTRALAISVAALTLLGITGCADLPDLTDLQTTHLARNEMFGTWTSHHAGSITFDPDGVARIRNVPLRGLTSKESDPSTPTSRTSRWTLQRNNGIEEVTICFISHRYADCTANVRGPRGHRELDLIVGDPDSDDWYRYHRT